MRIDLALGCAVITAFATMTVAGCASRDAGSEGSGRAPSSAGATATPVASTPTGSPTPTAGPSPTAVVHSTIGPLLAPTQALVTVEPGLTFRLEDTIGDEPALDAHGDIMLGTPLEALVYIDDADGPRTIALVDGKAYRNTGGPGEDAWKATDRGTARAEVDELAVHRLLPALTAGVTGLKHVGVVEEAGLSLAHYTFTANTRKTLDSMDLEMEAKSPRTMTGELWLAADSGVLTRVHMAIDDFRHEIELDFGVDATIVAPPL